MDKLLQIEEIRKDYLKRYFEIIEKNGICQKAIEYSEKIDRIEKMIEQYEKAKNA